MHAWPPSKAWTRRKLPLRSGQREALSCTVMSWHGRGQVIAARCHSVAMNPRKQAEFNGMKRIQPEQLTTRNFKEFIANETSTGSRSHRPGLPGPRVLRVLRELRQEFPRQHTPQRDLPREAPR